MGRDYLWIKYFLTQIRTYARKPKLLARMISVASTYYFTNQDRLRTLNFANTYDCNFNCQHCYAKQFAAPDDKQLTKSEKIDVIQQALGLGVVTVDFIGGESLMDPDLDDLIRACDPPRCQVAVTTNGWLLTRDRLRHLRSIGLDAVRFSLDSGLPQEHDAFRRRVGSFDRVIEGIDLCRDLGVETSIVTTVARDTVKSEGFLSLVDYCRKTGLSMTISVAAPLGNWQDSLDSMISQEEEQRLRSICDNSGLFIRDTYRRLNRQGCPGFKQIIYVTQYGDVLPCPFVHIAFGNIRSKTLKEIRDVGLSNKYFHNYHPCCLAGEDRVFMQSFLQKCKGSKKYPLDADEFFDHGQFKG